ncbi:hypothetical protein BDR07DRAFT_1408078 [Suillus spraguei]|nr:hypothetical protein BDR07DRAFT_1408078 [Suillus spraguei]
MPLEAELIILKFWLRTILMILLMSLLARPSLYHKHIQHTPDMLLQELMAFHHHLIFILPPQYQVPQSLTLAQIVAGAAPRLLTKTIHTHHMLSISNIIHRSLASHLLMSNSTYNNSIYSSRTLIIQHIMVFIAWASSMSNTHPSHPLAAPSIIDPLHTLHMNPATFLPPSSMSQ